MISKTTLACTIALLSVLTCSDHVFAQRGGRGAGGGGGAGAPMGENGDQGMAGRGGRRGAAGGQAGNAARGATSKLFAAIDENQDGVITREEMKEAMQAFAKLDEDKDGKSTVSPERLDPSPGCSTSLFGWNTFRPTSKREAVVVPTAASFVLSRYFARICVNALGPHFSAV